MTQYNANPNPTSNTTGYVRDGVGTMTATADGLRIQRASVASWTTIWAPRDPTTGNGWVTGGQPIYLAGWQVRRNTAASATPWIDLSPAGGSSQPFFAPVGSWVALPRVRGGSPGVTGQYVRIMLQPNKAYDFTIKGMYAYNSAAAPASGFALDANDVDFVVAGVDHSLDRTFTFSLTNNEAVESLTWQINGAHKATETADTSGSTTATPAPVTHTFSTAGLYTVTCTGFGPLHGSGEPQSSWTATKQIMVPTGPFVADFTHSESSLNLSVNAGISQVPTYDTISSYTWEWGDGTPNGSGITANHTYAEPGTYAVKLTTRTPATLRESTKTYNIVVELPPTPPADLTEAIAKSIFTGRFSSWDVGARVEELPTPTDFSFAVPADDMPSLTMTYSLKGENGDKVRDLVGEEYDLAFEVFNPVDYQWFEPRGCRWVVQDDDLNLMDATGMVKLRAVGVANDLDGIIVTARESASVGKTFKTADGDVNAGRIMGTLLEGEVLEFDHVITRDFTNTHDSSSTAFSKELNSNYEVGASQTFLQVLQDLTEMGLCHWSTQGNELLLFDDGSPEYGLDLAFGGADDVYLLPGREIKAIQTSRSRRDYLHTLYIPKSDGTFYKREAATPVSRRGKKAQLISGNAVATSGDADLISGPVFDSSGKITREQYTYELNLSSRLGEGGALPFVDYNPGDLVWAIGATGGLEPMQVQQITLQGGAGKPLEGSVILADRILLQSVQRAKNTARALGSGAHYTNTIVGRTTTETPYGLAVLSSDQSIPNATETVITPSTATVRGGVTYSAGAFTVPTGGLYELTGWVTYNASGTGSRILVFRRSSTSVTQINQPASSSGRHGNNGSLVILCGAGDTLYVRAYQSSGAAMDALSGASGVSIAKIGD